MCRVTPVSTTSGVAISPQFSAVKSSSASSIDHLKVHSLPQHSSELRRDSFPPYVGSASKRSTAVVAPSLARSRPTTLASTSAVHMPLRTPLRFPFLQPTAQHHQLTTTPNLYLHSPTTTQSPTRAMADISRRYGMSTSVCRASARSLLAPSASASTGISYSLALSSPLASDVHSSASHSSTSNLSAGQSSSHALHLRHIRPITTQHSSLRLNRTLGDDAYLERRNTVRDVTRMYNDFYAAAQQRTCTAVTTTGHSAPVDSLTARYQSYGLNQTLRPSCAQYPTGSALSMSNQHLRLHLSGRFTQLCVEIVITV